MNILVIGSHFDDEVLGVGGTIAKHISNGDEVHVLILTDSSSTQYPGNSDIAGRKTSEAKEANKYLGSVLHLESFSDMKLDTIPQCELASCISGYIDLIQPEIVYTHSKNDLNKDHRMTYEASMVACRPMSGVKKILCYEVLSSTEWGEGFKPNYYVDITEFIRDKVNAFKTYKTEMRKLPHPRSLSGVYSLGEMRGTNICVPFAEAFELIMEVE